MREDCTKEWRIKDDCNKYDPPRKCVGGECVEESGCVPEFIGIGKCDGGKVVSLYRNADCSEEWKTTDDCSKYTPHRICENGGCVEKSTCQDDAHPPELYDPVVTPDCDRKDSTFTFSVTYKDEDGDLPAVANIWVRGYEFGGTHIVYDDTYYHDMLPLENPPDVIRGARYGYSVQLPQDGEYYYRIYFTNTKGCRVDLPDSTSETLGLTGPKVKDCCETIRFTGTAIEFHKGQMPGAPDYWTIKIDQQDVQPKPCNNPIDVIIYQSINVIRGKVEEIEIGDNVEVYGAYCEKNDGSCDVTIYGSDKYYIEKKIRECQDIKFSGTCLEVKDMCWGSETHEICPYWVVSAESGDIRQKDITVYVGLPSTKGSYDKEIAAGDQVDVFGCYYGNSVSITNKEEYYIKKIIDPCAPTSISSTGPLTARIEKPPLLINPAINQNLYVYIDNPSDQYIYIDKSKISINVAGYKEDGEITSYIQDNELGLAVLVEQLYKGVKPFVTVVKHIVSPPHTVSEFVEIVAIPALGKATGIDETTGMDAMISILKSDKIEAQYLFVEAFLFEQDDFDYHKPIFGGTDPKNPPGVTPKSYDIPIEDYTWTLKQMKYDFAHSAFPLIVDHDNSNYECYKKKYGLPKDPFSEYIILCPQMSLVFKLPYSDVPFGPVPSCKGTEITISEYQSLKPRIPWNDQESWKMGGTIWFTKYRRSIDNDEEWEPFGRHSLHFVVE